MIIKRKWKPVGSLVKVSFPELGIVPRNRVYLTISKTAGLLLVNIILSGYKLWFGISRDFKLYL